MEERRASPDVLHALQQMGFPPSACVQAAVCCDNNLDAAAEWLLAASKEQTEDAATRQAYHTAPAHPDRPHAADAAEEGSERETEGAILAGTMGASWQLVGGTPESPLSVLSGVDQFNIHDTGMGGWVIMHGAFGVAEPLLFVGERSSWYGRLFAGRAREATYDLCDTSWHPVVRMEKAAALTSTAARVLVLHQGEGPVGPSLAACNHVEIGCIASEWDPIKRRLVLTDSTPNHSAGSIVVESPSVLDDTFRVKRAHVAHVGDTHTHTIVLGTIVRPRNGMGIASVQLSAGALDAYRADRMRCLILCAALLVCDCHWNLTPGASTFAKALLPWR